MHKNYVFQQSDAKYALYFDSLLQKIMQITLTDHKNEMITYLVNWLQKIAHFANQLVTKQHKYSDHCEFISSISEHSKSSKFFTFSYL